MSEQHTKALRKTSKVYEVKKVSCSPKDQQTQSKKQQRKGENPVRNPPNQESCVDLRPNSWICKNSACRATLSAEDTFCKRCSCCICHLFDDNKDPSLWLECTSESGLGDACGLCCHIECALQRDKVGVVDLGLLMQLDGSYCCASCGKVSGILGCWKKQLIIAKDARRVDVLCYRIFLSYRLLDGTSRFHELHEIIKEAKAKLETEVGPVDGVSAKMARGIVSRLSAAVDVQRLCSLAVEKADELIASKLNTTSNLIEGSLPAACKFLFEEVTSSSIVVLLIELANSSNEGIKGYKLWYCKSKDENYPKEPASIFPSNKRRIWISNLQPCTEYSIRIVSYTESADYGHSEIKCFTKSVEIINKASDNDVNAPGPSSKPLPEARTDVESNSDFIVRDLGRILRLALACDHCSNESRKTCGPHKEAWPKAQVKNKNKKKKKKNPSSASLQLDLNVASVPDLNEEFTPSETDDDDDNDDALSHEIQRKNGEVPAVDLGLASFGKRKRKGEIQDSDSTLTNESGSLDENFEYCVKIIRWMECEGYIDKDFRVKLLTWFSLRSTEQERWVVSTFIQTLIDDPTSLAGQLVDSFSDIVSNKRPT